MMDDAARHSRQTAIRLMRFLASDESAKIADHASALAVAAADFLRYSEEVLWQVRALTVAFAVGHEVTVHEIVGLEFLFEHMHDFDAGEKSELKWVCYAALYRARGSEYERRPEIEAAMRIISAIEDRIQPLESDSKSDPLGG